MSRIHRALLLAFLALTLGFALAPVYALEPVPGPLVRCGTATGAGDTEAEAVQNAVDTLKQSLWFNNYTVLNSFCTEERIFTGNPLDPYRTIILCGAEVRACGFPKPRFP